jgi:proline racemase
MRDKQEWIARHADHLRTALLAEPRVMRHDRCAADRAGTAGTAANLVFMHASGFSSMCGHGLIAAITIAVERGLLTGPAGVDASLVIDTVAGPVQVRFDLARGASRSACRVERVRYRSQPARVLAPGLVVDGKPGRLRADLVLADGVYALVDAESAAVPLTLDALPELRRSAGRLFEALQPAAARHAPDGASRAWSSPRPRHRRADSASSPSTTTSWSIVAVGRGKHRGAGRAGGDGQTGRRSRSGTIALSGANRGQGSRR